MGFQDMYHCTIWIIETVTGNRPSTFANWKREIKFKLNGNDCIEPDCQVEETGAMYIAVIRARNVLGSRCRREKVHVSMEIDPLPDPTQHTCNDKCEMKFKDFQSYDSHGFCQASKPKNSCVVKPRYKNYNDVGTFIGAAIWF